jgi:nucleoside-diphosphate-sugar epimerase
MVEAAANHWPEGFKVFYPSSTAVIERPSNMTEYAMSKMAGELLCQDVNVNMKNVQVIMARLPRLPTDQTASFRPVEVADPIETMLPIIRHLHGVPT